VTDNGTRIIPYIEQRGDTGLRRFPVLRSPFKIGRSQEADHTIYSKEVSSFHAEIIDDGGRYLVRDLGSTNGTFVNGQRVDEQWIKDGDILHFAHEELRFGLAEMTPAEERTVASPEERQTQLIRETTDLQRVLSKRAVRAFFQPIVRLDDRSRVAYETLGRPALEGGLRGIRRGNTSRSPTVPIDCSGGCCRKRQSSGKEGLEDIQRALCVWCYNPGPRWP